MTLNDDIAVALRGETVYSNLCLYSNFKNVQEFEMLKT
jgi:hypothetical protein